MPFKAGRVLGLKEESIESLKDEAKDGSGLDDLVRLERGFKFGVWERRVSSLCGSCGEDAPAVVATASISKISSVGANEQNDIIIIKDHMPHLQC